MLAGFGTKHGADFGLSGSWNLSWAVEMSEGKVTLELTQAEALVLFEWLARMDSSEALPIEDEAEQKVLWKLEGQLEKTLPEPLAPDYSKLLAEARQRVREFDTD